MCFLQPLEKYSVNAKITNSRNALCLTSRKKPIKIRNKAVLSYYDPFKQTHIISNSKLYH